MLVKNKKKRYDFVKLEIYSKIVVILKAIKYNINIVCKFFLYIFRPSYQV